MYTLTLRDNVTLAIGYDGPFTLGMILSSNGLELYLGWISIEVFIGDGDI